MPKELRSLPEPWNGLGRDAWRHISALPHTPQHIAQARRIVESKLPDSYQWPAEPPGTLHMVWEEIQDAAERHVMVGIGADAAIAMLTRIGNAEARAALSRLATKPGGPASWDDAETALDALWELEKRDEGG